MLQRLKNHVRGVYIGMVEEEKEIRYGRGMRHCGNCIITVQCLQVNDVIPILLPGVYCGGGCNSVVPKNSQNTAH